MHIIVYTKKVINDIPKLKSVKLDKKARALIEIIKENPYKTPPIYEKLMGEPVHIQGVSISSTG